MAKHNTRVSLAVEGKQRRKAFRLKVGRLKDNIVKERRGCGMRYFFLFCGLHAFVKPESVFDLDEQLELFVEALWAEGEPKHLAADCLSGLALHLRSAVKGKLRGAWQLYEVWSKKEVPARAYPFLPVHALGIAAYFIFHLKDPPCGSYDHSWFSLRIAHM